MAANYLTIPEMSFWIVEQRVHKVKKCIDKW